MLSANIATKAAAVPRSSAEHYARALDLPRAGRGRPALTLADAAGLVVCARLVQRRGLSVRLAVGLARAARDQFERLLLDDDAEAYVVAGADPKHPGGIVTAVAEDFDAALDVARSAGGSLVLALDVRHALEEALAAIRAQQAEQEAQDAEAAR